jgi:hypothetical protein
MLKCTLFLIQEQDWGAKGQCFCKNQQIGYQWDFAMRLDCTIPGDDFMILYSLCIVSAVSGFFSNNCRMYREQNSDSWIHNTYFSLKLRNGPNELDCYMKQSWKDLPMKNTLAYWAHYEDNNVLWIRSQSFCSWNCFHDTLVDYTRQNLIRWYNTKTIQYHENRQ